MSQPLSAFGAWMERTEGKTAPNDEERLGLILTRARWGSSFTGSEMLWAIEAAQRGVIPVDN